MLKQEEASCEDGSYGSELGGLLCFSSKLLKLRPLLSCGEPSAIATIPSMIMSYMFEVHRANSSVELFHAQCNVGDTNKPLSDQS